MVIQQTNSMNIPQLKYEKDDEMIMRYAVTTRTIELKDWNIDVKIAHRKGQRSTMEDHIVLVKPYESKQTTYISVVIIDGHRTHPLAIDKVITHLKNLFQRPYTHTELQQLIYSIESGWQVQGGFVFHIVTFSYSNVTPNVITVQRYQVGDCNSTLLYRRGLILDWMVNHNVMEQSERQRVFPWIERQKVGGVLQCTRVVGNKKLKEQLIKQGASKDLLSPVVASEIFRMDKNVNKCLFIGGTDGCIQKNRETSALRIRILELWNANCIVSNLMYKWLEQSNISDNNALIMMEFQRNI